MRPTQALELHGTGHLHLSDFETHEIKTYPNVWFTGHPGVEKPEPRMRRDVPAESDQPIASSSQSSDDDVVFVDHKRHYIGCTPGDHLAYRFEINRMIGKGTFSKVLECLDWKASGQTVAVKVIRNAARFKNPTKNEIKILNLLGGKRNIIPLTETFTFRGHACLVFPKVQLSLREWLTGLNRKEEDALGVLDTSGPVLPKNNTLPKNNNLVGASLGFTKRVAVQMLQSLIFLKENNVGHCDVKLENVLLKSENSTEVVLCDFGSARVFRENNLDQTKKQNENDPYIQSRHYRAPEILLGVAFGCEIDAWSLGCVLSELFTGVPAFPGVDEGDQIGRITEVLGPVPEQLLRESSIEKIKMVEESQATTSRSPSTRSIKAILEQCPDVDFIDFIGKLWTWQKNDRLDVSRASLHPWIGGGVGFVANTIELSENSIHKLSSPNGTSLVPGVAYFSQSATLDRKRPKNVLDPAEIAKRDEFFKSLVEVNDKTKNVDSIQAIEKELAKSLKKTVSFSKATQNNQVKKELRKTQSARRVGDSDGDDDVDAPDSNVILPVVALLQLHPGMTEEVAKRVLDIKMLQAVYAAPTGPPRPPPSPSAKQYSGINPEFNAITKFKGVVHGVMMANMKKG